MAGAHEGSSSEASDEGLCSSPIHALSLTEGEEKRFPGITADEAAAVPARIIDSRVEKVQIGIIGESLRETEGGREIMSIAKRRRRIEPGRAFFIAPWNVH